MDSERIRERTETHTIEIVLTVGSVIYLVQTGAWLFWFSWDIELHRRDRERERERVHNYPVQIVDNRPAHPQTRMAANNEASDYAHSPDNHLHNIEGDVLVVQPLHLTESTSSSSSSEPASHPTLPRDPTATTYSGGPPLPHMDDLDHQAAEAIMAGRVPAWQVEGDGPSMRSSVRVDDNSHDLSWVQGVTPRTLPPPMPSG